MSGQVLSTRVEGAAQIVEFDLPERRNALTLTLLDQLASSLDRADRDEAIRGVVLTGAGEHFSAGADLEEARAAQGIAGALRYLTTLRRAGLQIEAMTKPVVAAIEGYCLTGGLELALACDVRFAARDSRFAITSARIGSVPGMGATQRLPRAVGIGRAKDLLFSGRRVTGEEAQAMGLVEHLCLPGETLRQALEWIELCARSAPISIWLAKLAVNTGVAGNVTGGLDLETALASLAFNSRDREEGMTAFLERRQPDFEGR